MPTSRYPRVNPKSGLKETWDHHFAVPSVTQRSITTLRFNGQNTTVHTVPLKNGLSLDFYARLGASDELGLTFHGAYRKDNYLCPRFERVRSLKRVFPTHIALADPTLHPDRRKKMLLSWFDMPTLCRRRSPENSVTYAQSSRGSRYLKTHFELFRAAMGATPSGEVEPRSRRWLALHDGAKEDHGAMTPHEFREHLDSALTWWRARCHYPG